MMADAGLKRRQTFPTWARIVFAILVVYLIGAYLIIPRLWKRHEARLADFQAAPRITHTASNIPGDPLNIGMLGTEEEVIRGMVAAGWDPADPLTFRTSARIVVDTILRRPDDQAPVSNLFLFGRREDLAFEKPVGGSPKERHHVRFWKMEQKFDDRMGWIGSAAYDIGVEFSRTTGQVTHHISPDIDAERDLLVADLTKAIPAKIVWLDGFHTQLQGRNGGGDPWRTDGRLAVVVLPVAQSASTPAPTSNESLR
jgi:LssY C-terminus